MRHIKQSERRFIHSMIDLSPKNCSMNLTLEEISAALGGTLEGRGNLKVQGYSIDTRTLKAGELFFAIKGPRFDGHEFLKQAFEKKAAAVVVDRRGMTGEGSIIRVPSTV